MSENTRQNCVLTFRTSLNRQKAIRFNDPRPDITRSHVISAASLVVGDGVNPGPPIFDETVGTLEELVKAEIVTVERTPVVY